MVWTLAFRNVFRNLRRSALTAVGIALAIGLMLTSMALNDGAWADMIGTAIRGSAGHVVVQADGWQADRKPEQWLDGASEIASALRDAYPGATVVRRAIVGGLLTSPTGSAAVELRGIEPDAERDLVLLDDKLVDGAWLEGDRGVLLGRKLADTLGVGLGDKVVFMAQVGTGEVESRLFRVRGVFRTGSEALDAFTAVAALPDVQPLFPGDDVAHQIAVVFPSIGKGGVDTSPARAALGARTGVDVLSWEDAMPVLKEQAALDAKFGNVLYGFMGLIVAVGVLNTVLMSVLERMREFGVLLALGLRPRDLAAMIVVEGGVLGLCGGVLGALLAVPPILWLEAYGIDYGDMIAQSGPVGDVALDTVLRAHLDPPKMATVAAIAAVVALLASLWPARHATRLHVVDALRHT